jgi:hypothetical protein
MPSLENYQNFHHGFAADLFVGKRAGIAVKNRRTESSAPFCSCLRTLLKGYAAFSGENSMNQNSD